MAGQEHRDRPMQLLWDKTSPQCSGFVNSVKGSYQVKRDALHNSHKEIGGIHHPQENTVLKKSPKLQQNSNEQWNKALANVRLRIDMPGRVSLEPTSGKMTVDRLPSPIIRKTPTLFRGISNPTKIILKNPITSLIYPSMNPPGQTSRQARKREFQEYQQGCDQRVHVKDNDGPDMDGRMPKRISLHPGGMQYHSITLSARAGSAVEDLDGLFGTSGLSDEPDLASDRKTSEQKLRSERPRSRHDRHRPPPPPPGRFRIPPPLPGQGPGPVLGPRALTLGTFEHKRDRSTMEQILEALPPRNVSAGSSSSGWNFDADKVLMAARARDMNWGSIQQAYFPHTSANACWWCHERLMSTPKSHLAKDNIMNRSKARASTIRATGRITPLPREETQQPSANTPANTTPEFRGISFSDLIDISPFVRVVDYGHQITVHQEPKNIHATCDHQIVTGHLNEVQLGCRKKISISSYTISEDLSGDRGGLVLSRITEKKRDGSFRLRIESSHIDHQSLRHRGETYKYQSREQSMIYDKLRKILHQEPAELNMSSLPHHAPTLPDLLQPGSRSPPPHPSPSFNAGQFQGSPAHSRHASLDSESAAFPKVSAKISYQSTHSSAAAADGCTYCGKFFMDKSNLKRHELACKRNPIKLSKRYVCNFPGCAKRYTRSDALLVHQRGKQHKGVIEIYC